MQNKGFIKGALLGALTVLLTMGVVSCGIGSALKHATGKSEKPVDGSVETKLELLDELVDNYYVGEKDGGALREGLYKGYIDGLGDPYSVYYDKEETKDMMESFSGEYSGIGAVLTQDRDTGVVTIVHLYPGSPAEEAGIKADDILYRVEDE